MRYLFVLLLLIPSIGAANTLAGKGASKTYDATGKLLQKTDANGRHYDAKGNYIGKTTNTGKHYNASGNYIGKTITTTSGSKQLDAKGKLQQKTDARGNIYNANGQYQGKKTVVSPRKTTQRNAKGKVVSVRKKDDGNHTVN